MHEVMIDSLLNCGRTAVDDLAVAQNEVLCFVIDQVRQPDALARIYGLGQPLEPTNLFINTEFDALAQQGPIWINASTPEMKALGADLCIERNAGICLLTNDVQHALAHARWLLKANDGTGGQSLLSYYRAELWAALTNTGENSISQLLGPWSAVLSPAPKRLGERQERWIEWRSATNSTFAPASTYFNLPPGCSAAQRLFAWMYWVDEYYEHFGKPQGESLQQIVANLTFLAGNRITQGRHLLGLSPLICGSLLQARPDVIKVLASSGPAFLKAQQLDSLPVTPLNNAASVG